MKNVGMIAAEPVKKWMGKSREEIRRNGSFVMFCFVLFGGIVWGAVSSRNAGMDTLKKLDFIFQTNFELRCSQGMAAAFVSSFASAALFMLVILLLGLSLWGGFLAAALPFFKGYGYGLSVGYLYGAYGFRGVLYLFRAPVRDDPKEQLKRYLIKMLRLSLLCLAASIVDVLCAFCFSWIFDF